MTKKLLTFLTLLTLFFGVGWAETATLSWSGNGENDNSNVVPVDDILTSSAYCTIVGNTTFTCTSVDRVYIAQSGLGLKLGASKNPGSMSFSVSGSIKPSKITVNAQEYGSDTGSIKITANANGATVTQQPSNVFSDITLSMDGNTVLSSLTVETTSKRAYVKSITIEYGDTPQPTTYNLTGTGDNGTVTFSVGGSAVTSAAAGATVTATATANTGYEFSSWTAPTNVSDWNTNGNVATFTMPAAAVTVTANFTEQSTGDGYFITFGDNGTDATNATTATILKDEYTISGLNLVDSYEITNFVAKGETGLKFASNKNSGTLTINLSSTGQAINAQKIKVRAYGNGKTMNVSINEGTSVSATLTGTSSSDYTDYEFSASGSIESITINAAAANAIHVKRIEIVEAVPKTYDVTVTPPTEGGTISVSPVGEKVADYNDVITVTVNPSLGYELATLTYTPNGGNVQTITPVAGQTEYTFNMPNANVTVTATFSKVNYNIYRTITAQNPNDQGGWIGDWVNCTLPGGASGNDYVVTSTYGTEVQFKAGNNEGYKILAENVSAKDANNNNVPLTVVSSDNSGIVFKFNMPASNVTISAYFTWYVSDLYILGTADDNEWAGNVGVKMDYNSSTEKYTKDVYFAGNSTDGAYGFFNFTESLGNADWSGMGTRYGSKVQDQYDLAANNYTGELSWWDEHKGNAFKVPAGLYTIEVNRAKSQVTVTPIQTEFTFTPAAGEVYQGTEVTATSNLYSLLHAINSSITESAVTNQVSLDGTTFSSSVALDNTGSATVTGKATYGHIAPTATATYTVNEIPAGSEFELVTSNDDIGEGVEYVIMNKDSGSGYAMSTTQNNNNRGQTDLITIANSKIIPTDNTQIITLEAADNGWYLKVQSNPDKYLYTVSSSNHLKTGSTLNSTDQYYIAKISVNETSHVATIEYQTPTKKYLRRNSGSNIFSCYESGQQEVYLYKRGTVTPTVAIPTFSPEAGTYNEAQSVTISCATDGATILYSTDGTNYSNYTGAITVSETTTLYAKATKDGVTSQVATAEYTINIPVVGSGDFTLVENDNAIKAGREYIIISKNKDYAAGAYSSGRFAGSTSFTLTNDDKTASIQNDVKVFTLEDSETEGYYYLKDSEGNYYTPSQSSGDISQTKTNLSVTYGSGFVKITTSSDTRQIGFNDQNGQKKFGSFTNSSLNDSQGGLHHIYLYYRDGGLQKPEFTPAPGMYDVDVDVTITCATDGATIYYTTDDSEPSATNGTEYTGEIVVSQTTTFKAIAVKDGETSQIVSATYTITPHTAIETVTLTYSEPFTSGIGKFVVQNESGFSPVWTLDGNYGIKGTSFSGGVNYAATSRFLSPIIDMTDATQPELTFAHQINSFFTNASEQCTLWIRETTNGTDGTWIQLPLSFQTPAQNDWSNDYADIDLSAYAGKKVQISFLYSNPVAGTGAGTWEIQHFVVADNSEYRMVNNIAEFLALENGTKAKFKNPVTVLYDYSQYSLNTYQEYIWVKDESGFTQIFLQPSLDGKYGANEYQRAYYENGDVIPAGFIVTKQYYANGGYYQAFSNQATEEDKGGFQEATQKALADPEPFTVAELANLEMSEENIATYNNRYVRVSKLKITSKSGKNFNFTNDQGITTTTVGYNKYSDSGSVLKDGNTSAVVKVPAAGDTYYDVTAILQKWGSVWEIMPITFTPWEEQKVTLRDLCEKGTVNKTYTISNRLQCVYIREGNKLWVKDDNGQSILKKAPAEGDNNYEIGEEAGNKQLDQSLYDQSNWLEVHLADGSADAETFYKHIIKGGAITGTFTNKTNPTMVNVELTSTALENSGTVKYAPNYYCAANFYNGIEGGNQACMGSENHGNFFFMNPKPQEYAMIVWAKYDGSSTFSVPTGNGANEHGFQGTFTVNLSMNPEGAFDPNNAENIGQVYNFEAIICRPSSGSKAGSGDYVVYPLNLSGDSVITNVVDVTGKAVAGVKYYNLAGMESDRPFEGVNIIVTTYTDGSRSSAKVLK